MNEFKNVEVVKERDKILFFHPKEPGKTQRIDEFGTIRAGVVWPTVQTPGYYSIIGAMDDLSAAEGISLVLIDEGKTSVLESLFEKVMLATQRFKCDRIYARLDSKKSPERAFYNFRGRRDIDCPGLLDSSEFENFNFDVTLIRQWIGKGALRLGPGSCLGKQLASLKPDDVNEKFEVNFFAVASFCRILKSLSIFPFQREKDTGREYGFSNVLDRARPKRDSGYFEIITK